MTVDLFAGVPVSDYQRALDWYERLLGSEPAFLPNATEAVWELAEHRYLYMEVLPERAGHAVGDGVRRRPRSSQDDQRRRPRHRARLYGRRYDNGVREVTYRDRDGNEIGFGGAPAE